MRPILGMGIAYISSQEQTRIIHTAEPVQDPFLLFLILVFVIVYGQQRDIILAVDGHSHGQVAYLGSTLHRFPVRQTARLAGGKYGEHLATGLDNVCAWSQEDTVCEVPGILGHHGMASLKLLLNRGHLARLLEHDSWWVGVVNGLEQLHGRFVRGSMDVRMERNKRDWTTRGYEAEDSRFNVVRDDGQNLGWILALIGPVNAF